MKKFAINCLPVQHYKLRGEYQVFYTLYKRYVGHQLDSSKTAQMPNFCQ